MPPTSAPPLPPSQLPPTDEPDAARSHWRRVVGNKRTQLVALSFFSSSKERALRPERHAVIGPPRTAADKWKRVRDASSAVASLKAARLRVRAAQGVAQSFPAEKGADGSPVAAYWEQGDLAMHTKACWELRMDLSTHELVADELHTWWLMLRRTFGAPAFDPERPSEWGLDESQYSRLITRLYKALIAPFDERDALKCARDDWRSDAHKRGHGGSWGHTLTRVALYDSMFELADIWTRGTRADEYVIFLRLLFDHVVVFVDGEAVLKPLAQVSWFDPAEEAERVADEQDESRRRENERRERRMSIASDFARRLGRRGSTDREAAAAAEAAARAHEEKLAAEEEARLARLAEEEAEREEELWREQQRKRDGEAARRAAAAAAAAEAAAVAAAARGAKLLPRGAWKDGRIPPHVLQEWARRAVKPGREHFSSPRQQRSQATGGGALWAPGLHGPLTVRGGGSQQEQQAATAVGEAPYTPHVATAEEEDAAHIGEKYHTNSAMHRLSSRALTQKSHDDEEKKLLCATREGGVTPGSTPHHEGHRAGLASGSYAADPTAVDRAPPPARPPAWGLPFSQSPRPGSARAVPAYRQSPRLHHADHPALSRRRASTPVEGRQPRGGQPHASASRGFRPSSARAASPRALPPAALAMQVALARSSPRELEAFYKRRMAAAAKLQHTAGWGVGWGGEQLQHRRAVVGLALGGDV
jgi:hypothetical protein